MKLWIVLTLVVQLLCQTFNTEGKTRHEKQDIHFGAFISNMLIDRLCYKAAIEAAVQMINEDETILKDYRVKMNYFDNYVNIAIIFAFFLF